MKLLLSLLAVLCLVACQRLPTYTVEVAPRNTVDDRLFGAFFEKATWGGEIGSDAAISLQTGEVLPEVREYMEWMNIPVLRFPGGTAIDYYPWWRLIDSMPGQHSSRPRNTHHVAAELGRKDIVSSDGRMGLHEFIHLCRDLDIRPLLVVNLGDAYYGKRPVEEAAQKLGGDFIHYCNDASGPWAELRAANGDAEPFGVKLWQIGNESWLFEGMQQGKRTPEALAKHNAAVSAYAKTMHTADPSIELIVDGMHGLSSGLHADIGELISYETFHSYSPWGIETIARDDQPLSPNQASQAEVWQGLATAPFINPATGLSELRDYTLDSLTGPLALTEWNLNTWFTGDARWARPTNYHLAYGIGAGSYLNALLRSSDRIKIANQSMLVGTNWDITGIRVDTTEATRPQLYPTALATGLYSRQHGTKFHEHHAKRAQTYAQPLRMSLIAPSPKVAEQDVAFTADEDYWYAHIVNRSFENRRTLRLRFPASVLRKYTVYLLSDDEPGQRSPYASVQELEMGNASAQPRKTLDVEIPAQSVMVVRVEKG